MSSIDLSNAKTRVIRGEHCMESAPTPPVAYLFGAGTPRPLRLNTVIVFGREPDVTVHLEGKFVSRHHARLAVLRGGRVVLEDLGTTNGTWMGETRLEAHLPRQLGDNACFRISNRLFWVVLGPSAERIEAPVARLPKPQALQKPSSLGEATERVLPPLDPAKVRDVLTTVPLKLEAGAHGRTDLPNAAQTGGNLFGALTPWSVPVLLHHLYTTRQTGDLELRGPERRYAIRMESGRMVFAYALCAAAAPLCFDDQPAVKGREALLLAASVECGEFRFISGAKATRTWNVMTPTLPLLFEACWSVERRETTALREACA
ncbi:MAG: FHA domain-containing protein [Planctomycetota bacterium]|nr:FHA domain-containing protein [Planctomycetota bacterium]